MGSDGVNFIVTRGYCINGARASPFRDTYTKVGSDAEGAQVGSDYLSRSSTEKIGCRQLCIYCQRKTGLGRLHISFLLPINWARTLLFRATSQRKTGLGRLCISFQALNWARTLCHRIVVVVLCCCVVLCCVIRGAAYARGVSLHIAV